MEIEIEKFQRRKLNGEDFLCGLEYCAKVDINTDVILNFWQKYFPDVKWIRYSSLIGLIVIPQIYILYRGNLINRVLSCKPSKKFLCELVMKYTNNKFYSIYFRKIYPKKIDVQ